MTKPPQFRRVSWSLVVSHSTVQKQDCRVRLRISLKEKLSAISARRLISISWEEGGVDQDLLQSTCREDQ